MVFEFFRFPYEIRELVYKATFDTPEHDGIIVPDQHHTRSKSGRKELTDRIIGGAVFLRTCQQAYAEAYPFLYKDSNIYYFDDVAHSSELLDLFPDARCECIDEHRSLRRYEYVPICRSHMQVPRCDFTAMLDWFRNIGERNRLRVRHIHLHFNGPTFTLLRNVRRDVQPNPEGGNFIDQTLKILAPAHNLETIKISFAEPSAGASTTETIELWDPIVEAFNNVCPYWGQVFEDKLPLSKDIIKASAPRRKDLPSMDLAYSLMEILPIKLLTVEGETPPPDVYHAYAGSSAPFAIQNLPLEWMFAQTRTPRFIKVLQKWMVDEYKPGQEIAASPLAWSEASVHQYSYLESGSCSV